MKTTAQQTIERLRSEIGDADYKYFVLCDPDMSDEQYDSRVRHLERLERFFPEYAIPGNIGSDLIPQGHHEKRRHRVPMLSLRKVYTWEEVEEWMNSVQKELAGQYE